ncbi:MAG: hypothetical protein JRF60_13435 [Deltaproteobacteria bacterium]|nr:hypothetical protein [Deltaproteobacteria bacterium]
MSEGRGIDLPLKGAVGYKAPVFALGYAEAGKGTKAKGPVLRLVTS